MKGEQQPIRPEDLDRCAAEPIHIPGAIQPHGYLLVCRGPGLELLQVSANVQQLFGEESQQLLGRPLAALLGEAQVAQLHGLLQSLVSADPAPLRFLVQGRPYEAIVHDSDGAVVVELEPGDPDPQAAELGLARAVRRLHASNRIADLHRVAVQAVRELTGYDRVMLYQFDDDGHGAVVAEAKAAELEPYLGLHYPATDIPAQARELYRRNWLRIIPDAGYTPVPLVPERRPDTGKQLDMSFAVLRSVSPIHREYMANAGFRASMSISLLRNGELWGLITCVHGAPRGVPYPVRRVCESIGQLLSLQNSALHELQESAQRREKQALLDQLRQVMVESDSDIPRALLQEPDALLELVGATGGAVICDDEIRTVGGCPPEAEITAIAQLVTRDQQGGVYCTDHLPGELPAASRYPHAAAGVLAAVIPKPGNNLVLWFLPEQEQTVSWAGEPVKTVESGADGVRLHPRRSFALWQDQVRGRSRRWRPVELWAVRELRRCAVELDLERQVIFEQIAVKAREELIGVVSHDLRTPLSVVQIHSGLLKRQLAGGAATDSVRLQQGLERIETAARRMQTLIQDLLLVSNIEAGRFQLDLRTVPVTESLDEVLYLLGSVADAKGIELVPAGACEASARADPDRLFQVLSNLVGNAVKFTPEGGRVRLGCRTEAEWVEYSVSDTGPGIPADQRLLIFQRHYGGRTGGGVGLGLYIARNIVEAHGGHLWVESDRRGSTFRFRIPRAA